MSFSGFGSFGNQNTSSSTPPNAPGTPAPANIFGAPNSTNTTTSTPAPLFGGTSVFGQTSQNPASNTPSTPSQPNIFGGTGLGANATTSTTPAGPPSANSNPSNIFSSFGMKRTESSTAPAPSSNIFSSFGAPNPPATGEASSGSVPSNGSTVFGSFGMKKPETSTIPAPSQNSFVPLFGAKKQEDAAKPASIFPTPAVASLGDTPSATPSTNSNLFGSFPTKKGEASTPTSTGDSTNAAPSASSNLFGGFGTKKPEAVTAPNPAGDASNAVPSVSSNLFGGFGIKKPETAATPTPAGGTTATAPSTSSSNIFGSFGAKKPEAGASTGAQNFFSLLGAAKQLEDPEQVKATATASTTTSEATGTIPAVSPSPNLFSGFGTKKPEASTTPAPGTTKSDDTAKTATTTPATTAGTAAPVASATAAATMVPGPPPSMLRGKSIEEILTKWNSELDVQTKEFTRMANEVAVWDRTLMENSEKINFLYNKVTAAHTSQNAVQASLEHIQEQQTELSKTLDQYEEVTKQILYDQGRALDLGPADRERDNSYGLATSLNSQLDDLSQSLTSMIETVNSLSSIPDSTSGGAASPFPNGAGGNDPISQIEAILNAHLASLQWIDGAVKELEGKVREVEVQQDSSDAYSSAYGSGHRRGFGLGPR